MRLIIMLILSSVLTGCGGNYLRLSSDVFNLAKVAGAGCKGMNTVTSVTAGPVDEVELSAYAERYVTPSGFVRKSYGCNKRSKVMVPVEFLSRGSRRRRR